MGCHTWFSVPIKTDKKEITELAQKFLNNHRFLTDGHKQMYQYAIDNDLRDVIIELASHSADFRACPGRWVLYQDERHYVVDEYNKKMKLVGEASEVGYYDFDEHNRLGLLWCGSEPRIGGYPDTVIESYDELVEFMETGYHTTIKKEDGTEEPKHYTFRPMEDDRKELIMANIKRFFETYPQGIITFG